MELFEKLYDKTLRFLSYRPRSEKEIRDYLEKPKGRKGEKATQAIVEKVVSKLKVKNFINDGEFTAWWVEQRTQSRKPKGSLLIKLELQKKGIEKETIDMVLKDYNSKALGQDALRRLLVKQSQRYGRLPRREAREKLIRFLLGRGFDWEAIDGVLKKE